MCIIYNIVVYSAGRIEQIKRASQSKKGHTSRIDKQCSVCRPSVLCDTRKKEELLCLMRILYRDTAHRPAQQEVASYYVKINLKKMNQRIHY